MRKLNVDVREDSARPGGGHAIIRFLGLETLPDSITYRIKSVEGGFGREQGAGWLDSERTPLATRLTAEGAELVVGPEIVENPLLLPGTLAVIEIAKCGVRGEFLWPRISPVQRPKRKHLIGMKPAREQATATPPIAEIEFTEATDSSSEIDPSPLPTPSIVLITPEIAEISKPIGPPPAPIEDVIATSEMHQSAIDSDDLKAKLAPTAPSEAPEPIKPARDVEWNEVTPKQNSTWRSIAIAASVSGLAVLGLTHLIPANEAPSKPKPLAVTEPAPRPQPTLAGLFAVAATSPRGLDVSALTQQRLLEEADTRLHAEPGGRDRAEAEFLLRRYIGTALGEDRTIWALTQLGSLYAEPGDGTSPDYGKARQLWELSSTLGDSVAMCFLASLHEHGLGVKPNPQEATKWFAMAKDTGNCPTAGTAIQRLKAKP